MNISGLQKMTLLDYPGKVACTVFLGGCNFRCPFCHNSELLDGSAPAAMDDTALMAFLKKRVELLDGVCVTGGEPTVSSGLPELLGSIRALGYAVKLDTNGYRPDVLRTVVNAGLVDYVAMDIKNGPSAYAETAGLPKLDLSNIEESIRFLSEGHVDYEFRTTVVAPLHSRASIQEMADWLQSLTAGRKPPRLFLQPFTDRDTVPFAGFSAPSAGELLDYVNILSSHADSVTVRGAG